jgi:hypothetical protein
VKDEISPRDMQEISAYLDDQLNEAARTRLEARLKSEPALGATLDDLRWTRAMLRALPRLRAPRSFALSPAMAGKRQGFQPYPVLRLATVLASFLFVILLAGDLFNLRNAAFPQQAALPAESALQAKVAQPEAGAALQAAPQAYPPPEVATSMAQAPEATSQLTSPPAALLLPQPTPTPEGTPQPLLSAKQAQVTATPAAKLAVAPSTTTQPAEETQTEEQRAADQALIAASGLGAAKGAGEEQAPAYIFGINQTLWRTLEALTALIAVLAGLALLLRRR